MSLPSVHSEAPTYPEDRGAKHPAVNVNLDTSVENKPLVDGNMSDAVFLVVMVRLFLTCISKH